MEEIYFVHKCKYLVMLVVLSMFCSTAFAAEDGDVFRKIISVNDLQDGDEIIFVCSNGENQAMNKTWTGNTVQAPGSFRYSSLETTLGVHRYDKSSDILVWKVYKVGDNFAFKIGAGYLGAESSSTQNLTLSSVVDPSKNQNIYTWKIEVRNGQCNMYNDYSNYRSRSIRFDCSAKQQIWLSQDGANYFLPCIYKNYKTDSPVSSEDNHSFREVPVTQKVYCNNSVWDIDMSTAKPLLENGIVVFKPGNSIVVNSYNYIYAIDLDMGGQTPTTWFMNGKTTSKVSFTSNTAVKSIVVRYGESRPVSAIGEIGTICLPYDVALGDIKGASCYETYYKEPVMDGETVVGYDVYFKEVTDGLKAGYPYIYQCEEETDVVSFGFSGDRVTEGRHKNGLYGTLDRHPFASDQDYRVNEFCVFKSGNLKYASSNSGVNAGRAYIRMSEIANEPDGSVGGNVKVLRLGMDDDNAIRVLRDENTFGSVYDLQGIRQQGQQKKRSGLYIVNGRKFLSR